ncbi:MAG: polysaccharide deacetylase [Eubacteriales bacterium]|nr:polysaccharide deacetylase [Eubacteriales bacterium]
MKNEHIDWPDNAKCAVLFTIHVDGESLYNYPGEPDNFRMAAYGTYGPRRAVDRILDLLERKHITCSFFIPGQIADRYPDMVRKIDSQGHEIGFHGYDHESSMYTDRSREEWMAVIEKAQNSFERIIGKRAKGYVATSCDFQKDAPQIWHEMGFSYSSSMRGDDRPYRWDFGKGETDFIEIPARWELDDYPAFVYSFDPPQPAGQDRISSYRGVFSNWKHEFDGYYSMGGCMCWMLHPQIIGIPGRLDMLEELIDYMQGKNDVWFAPGSEIAAWWRRTY